jgi:3-hydroxyisobutyrate dehydrogenase
MTRMFSLGLFRLGLLSASGLALACCAATERAETQVTAVAQAQAVPTLSTADAAFIDQAGRAGIEEVTFGQLARAQAAHAAVRDFGMRMVDDHTRLNQALTQLAARKQIAPTVSMDTAHQDAFDALQQLHGRAFDRAYLNGQVTDHQTVLALFRQEAASGADRDVKAFAANAIPMLDMHLHLAERLGGQDAAAGFVTRPDLRRGLAPGRVWRKVGPGCPGGVSMETAMNVGVIGLGSMGMGVALNLVEKQFRVFGCDLRPEARATLEQAGGTGVGRPADLPGDLAALIVLVLNGAQTEAVLFGADGVAPVLSHDCVVLCCATVAPDFARALGARMEAAGLPMLDAPVSGGAGAARRGTMTVIASGAPAAFLRAEPVLGAIAAKVWRLGDAPGIGSTVKMVNQLLAGVHIATAAEALALGIRAGADPHTLFEVISASAGSSWMWQNRVPHILAGDDTPFSAVDALKFPLPLAATAHQLFLAASAAGHGGRDDAFVIRVWEALTGITLPAAASPPDVSRPG